MLAAAAVAAAWWFLTGWNATPDWELLPQLDLEAPAGDAFLPTTPWVRLQLEPGRPGEPNTLRLSLPAADGTPETGAGAGTARITALSARPLAAAPNEAAELPLTPGENGELLEVTALDPAGWWALVVDVAGPDGMLPPAEFHLLVPDPNLNGPGSVRVGDSVDAAAAVFRRGMAATAALRSVRFTQWNSDGQGNSSISEHAVSAGGDDQPPGFTYRAAGGMEAVVIGSTRWILLRGNLGWQRQEGAPVVPPSEWGEEYTGATGFTILGEETVDGERCQLLAFVVPEVTEPRRQVQAWYLWWVGTETGHVRKEAMVSRQHYMLNHFVDFDLPIELTPPAEGATPAAGTPAA